MFISGLLSVLQPAIESVDAQVQTLRESQLLLRDNIDRLNNDLSIIGEVQKDLPNLEHYVKKLMNIKRRVTTVNSVLVNVQDRVHFLEGRIKREKERKQTLIDLSSTSNMPP